MSGIKLLVSLVKIFCPPVGRAFSNAVVGDEEPGLCLQVMTQDLLRNYTRKLGTESSMARQITSGNLAGEPRFPVPDLSPRMKKKTLMFSEGVPLLMSLEQGLHRKRTGLSLNVILLHFSQRSIEFRVPIYGISVDVKCILAQAAH